MPSIIALNLRIQMLVILELSEYRVVEMDY
jgi:hypothetical protein